MAAKTVKKVKVKSSPKSAPKAAAKPVEKKPKVTDAPPKIAKPKKVKRELIEPTLLRPMGTIDPKNLTDDQLENYKKWLKLQRQLEDKKTEEYKMSSDFELKTPLKHKVHGWGVVIQRRDNYIDVLFENGMKTLIVNYKL